MNERRNLPSFHDLAKMTLVEIQGLDVDALEALQAEIAAWKEDLGSATKVLARVIADLLEPFAHTEFKAAEKDTGTVTIERDGREIKAERDKTVVWDQAFLGDLYAKIESAGDDPAVYIKRTVTYAVAENAYKDWPIAVQRAFQPGRTVKAGVTKFTIKPKEA